MEGGLGVDLNVIKKQWSLGVLVSMSGVVLPMLFGCWFGFVRFKAEMVESLVLGCILTSTSIGMATSILGSTRSIHTELGTLVIVAAMMDNIVCLILLPGLQALSGMCKDDRLVETSDLLAMLPNAWTRTLLSSIFMIGLSTAW